MIQIWLDPPPSSALAAGQMQRVPLFTTVALVLEVADNVVVEQAPRPVPVTFPRGRCSVAVTTNPFGLPASLNMHTFAVLANWLTDEPVGMWVTFRLWQEPNDPSRLHREVHAIFAPPSLRGIRTVGEPTIPVAPSATALPTPPPTASAKERGASVSGQRSWWSPCV